MKFDSRFSPIVAARSILALAVLSTLAACAVSTISTRKTEKSAVYQAATPAQQKTIDEGWIDSGFSKDMVYVALGKPDDVQVADPDTETWIYRNFASAPASASLGKAKGTVTSLGGSATTSAGQPTSGAGIGVAVRPDVGSEAPAEDIPNLYVYFYKNMTMSVKVKRG